MKALIIGGAGFVGAYLMRYLKEELHMEVTVTKMPQEQIEAENVKVCDLDILKKDDITGLFKAEQPDWIFHLAAQSSVSVSWKNPALTIDVNVKGGSNVLEAFRESGIKARMLLIGSGDTFCRKRHRLKKITAADRATSMRQRKHARICLEKSMQMLTD